MKVFQILLAIILVSSVAFSQAVTNKVLDRFPYADGDSLTSLHRSWKKYPASFTGDSAIYVLSGMIQAHNNLGAGRQGGAIFDSVITLGPDTIVAGIHVNTKGGPGSNTLNPIEIRLMLMMDTNTVHWSGYYLNLTKWNTSDYHAVLFKKLSTDTTWQDLPANQIDEVYNNVPDQYSATTTDSICVKIYGTSLQFFVNNSSGQKVVTWNGGGTVKSITGIGTRGRFGLLMRNVTPQTTIDDFILGVSTAAAVVPSTRDTVKPNILSLGPSIAGIDTSKTFSISYHVRDTVDASQKSTGLKRLVWRLKTIGGTQVDSQIVNVGAAFDTTITKTGEKLPVGTYVLTDSAYDDSANVQTYANQYGSSVQFTVGTASTMFVMAYYGNWLMRPLGQSWGAGTGTGEPPNVLNYSNNVSHIIEFGNGNIETNSPYFGPVNGVNATDSLDWAYGPNENPAFPYRDQLITLAHAASPPKRVLICMQAVNPANLKTVIDANGNGVIDGADSAQTDVLCQSVAAYASRHSYDGVDVNIENAIPTKLQISMLLRRLRVALNAYSAGIGGPMQITLAPTSGDYNSYDATTCNANVDFINPQTYDNQYTFSGCSGGNTVWFAANVYPPSNAQLGADSSCFGARNLVHSSSQHGANNWVSVGHTRSHLGIGISTYGRLRMFTQTNRADGTTRPAAFCSYTSDGYAVNNAGLINSLLTNGGVQQSYDNTTKSIAINGTATNSNSYMGTGASLTAGQSFSYTYPNAQVVTDVVQMIRDSAYGGIMLYEYNMDEDPSNANPALRNWIIEAAASAAGGAAVTQPPSAPTNSAPSNNATGQAITGVVFTWSAPSTATTYHYQISTDSTFTNGVTQFDVATNTATNGAGQFNMVFVYGLKYYWHVNAGNAAGNSAYSTKFAFTVVTQTNIPSVPTRVSPTNGATVTANAATLVISLNGTDTVTANNFQIKTDTTLGTFFVNDSSSATTNFVTPVLTNLQTYFWRAASKNTAGKSAFTGWWRFKDSLVASVLDTLHQVGNWFDPTTRQWKNIPKGGEEFQNIPGSSYLIPATSSYLFGGPLGYKTSDGVFHPYQTTDITTTANTWGQYQTFNGGLTVANGNMATASITTLSVNGTLATNLIPNTSSANVGLYTLGLFSNPYAAGYFNNAYKVFQQNGVYVTDDYPTRTEQTWPYAGCVLLEDFMFNGNAGTALAIGTSTVGAVGQNKWSVFAFSQTASGGGVTYLTPATATQDSSEPGMIALNLGTCGTLGTANGGAFTFKGSTTFGSVNARMTPMIMQYKFYVPSTADSLGVAGGLSATTDSLSFIASDSSKAGIWTYVQYGASNTDTLWAVSCNGTSATKTKTMLRTVPSGQWYKVRTTVYRSSIFYEVWSDQDNFTFSNSVTISTNLPANPTNTSPFLSAWNRDKSTTKQVKYGYYGIWLGGLKR